MNLDSHVRYFVACCTGLILGYAHLALAFLSLVFIIIALAMFPAFVDWITQLVNSIQ